MSRTTHIEELPSHDSWWPSPVTSAQPQPGSVPDRDQSVKTVLVGPDGRSPLIQRVPVPFGFRPERAR